MSSATTIGFIGLGQMGGAMALNLLTTYCRAEGKDLLVFDHSPEATRALEVAGATVCQTADDLARRCDTVFLCLPYAPEVRATIFSPQGLLDGWYPDRHSSAPTSDETSSPLQHRDRKPVIIDTTTLDRGDAMAFATELDALQVDYFDCPVSGLPKRASEGTLTVMFGGSQQAFLNYQPMLDSFAEKVIHCGDTGAGQAMKAVNNIIYNINIAALCEVLPLALASGLKPQQLADVVTSGSSRSFASNHFIPRILEGRFDGDFAMQDAHKDIVNMQGMAAAADATMPVTEAMVALYERTLEAGSSREAKSAMIKLYEKELGVQLRKD